jgi:hypothetical protein
MNCRRRRLPPWRTGSGLRLAPNGDQYLAAKPQWLPLTNKAERAPAWRNDETMLAWLASL